MSTASLNSQERERFGSEPPGFEGFVGTSSAMKEIYRTLAQVGPSSASVLLVGESGTGKELAAKTLHRLSERSKEPFIALNCAAIPDTLIESELFGHEKGAFTGATSLHRGCFELADRGTLFLDELGTMPLSSQVKLLRALEEQSFRRLRGSYELSVDVRIVAAVGEPPEIPLREGRLRSDLLYRINVFTITLPPLRERATDVIPLAEHFIEQFSRENGKEPPRLDDATKRELALHVWPGNVRELRNAMERAVILANESRILPEHLPAETRSSRVPNLSQRQTASDRDPDDCEVRVGMTFEEASRALVLRTLRATGYNKTETARMLRVSAKTVYNKLKEWAAEGDVEAMEADRRASSRGSLAAKEKSNRDRLVSIGSARANRAG